LTSPYAVLCVGVVSNHFWTCTHVEVTMRSSCQTFGWTKEMGREIIQATEPLCSECRARE